MGAFDTVSLKALSEVELNNTSLVSRVIASATESRSIADAGGSCKLAIRISILKIAI
jgi:hypothetical protein